MVELMKSDEEFARDINPIKDPRQLKCIALWRDPMSDTFGNLKQSAILAGYDELYADHLSNANPAWLMESAKADIARVKRAERNFDNVLHFDIDLNGEYDIDLARLQIDVSKTILKSLAKSKYDTDAPPIPPSVQINIVNYNKQFDKAPNNEVIETTAKDIPTI